MNELEKEALSGMQNVNAKMKHVRRVKYLLYVLLAIIVGLLLLLYSY